MKWFISKLPTVLKLGAALLSATEGDERHALRVIRKVELDQQKARDERMGR